MNAAGKTWSWFNDRPHRLVGVRVLQVSIGLLLCFRMATEWHFAAFLWGPHGVGDSDKSALFGNSADHWLAAPFQVTYGVYALVCATWIAACGLIFGKWTRLSTIAALALTILFEERLSVVLDGGDNITRLLLGYGVFLLPASARWREKSLRVFMHNIAVAAITAQIVIMYLTAGLMKANGAHWVQGTSLYLVSQVEWFSLPSTRWLFRDPFVTTAACYMTIFYQLWFPFAIASRLKMLWVALGIFFHIGIAYTMGLIPFSTIMIGIELFLLGDDEWHQGVGRAIDAWRRTLLFMRRADVSDRGEAGSRIVGGG